MAKDFPNLEKLAGRTYYTGYCAGEIYRVLPAKNVGWRAMCISTQENEHGLQIVCKTLNGISNALQRRDDHIAHQRKARAEGLTRKVLMIGEGASVRALISAEIDIVAAVDDPDCVFMRYNLDEETFEPVSPWLTIDSITDLED